MQISFKNNWCPSLVIIALVVGIYVQSLNVLFDFSYLPLIHLLLSIIVVFSLLLLDYNSAKISVKIWASLGIIGGGLGLISILLLYMIGRLEGGLELKEVIRHSIHLVTGCIIFFFWNGSVSQKG